MTDKKTEALNLALKRAFNLGQTYWQQADSEHTSQWKKADVTLASFNQLVEDTIREALAEQPAQQPTNCRHCGGAANVICAGQCKEQPAQQQEPVAWLCMTDQYSKIVRFEWETFGNVTPLYKSPPASKPLTDEMVVAAARVLSDRQAAACNVDCGDMWKMHGNDFLEDALAALEAAHGIKE